MKWLIGIVVAFTLTTSGCVTPPAEEILGAQFVRAEVNPAGTPKEVLAAYTFADVKTTNTQPLALQTIAEQLKQEKQLKKLNKSTATVIKATNAVKARVGKTWYVFSGASPNGWDCSGLVLWAYEQMNVELPHRASEQKLAGKLVTEPKLGDIVAFTYKGSKTAYHVGLYLGEGKMVHAPRPGVATSIEDVEHFANGSKISYTRILDTM